MGFDPELYMDIYGIINGLHMGTSLEDIVGRVLLLDNMDDVVAM